MQVRKVMSIQTWVTHLHELIFWVHHSYYVNQLHVIHTSNIAFKSVIDSVSYGGEGRCKCSLFINLSRLIEACDALGLMGSVARCPVGTIMTDRNSELEVISSIGNGELHMTVKFIYEGE